MTNLELDFDWDLDLSLYYLYKVENGREYYLKDVKEDGRVIWTAQLRNALEFVSEDESERFIEGFFPNRTDFCITRR